jgi:hypothetical protein
MSTIGKSADDPLREVDLRIDPEGHELLIDGAAHELMVQPAVTWTGKTASEEV